MSEPARKHALAATDSQLPSETTRQSPLRAATCIKAGRYHLLKLIGEGGMGKVYEAYDPDLSRRVAIKILRTNPTKSLSEVSQGELRWRLVREAKALAKLSHENVVAIYDVGILDDDGVFLAMEYIAGENLREHLSRPGIGLYERLALFLAAGNGLAAAHRRGIIHRDFKPENVLIGQDAVVKVLDFGLASDRVDGAQDTAIESGSRSATPKLAGERAGPPLPVDLLAHDDEQQTAVGSLLGTLRYMAPEQLRGEPCTSSADVFAFCTAVYESVCGAPPFAGKSAEQKLWAIEHVKPRWPAHAPNWLCSIINQGLEADPAIRPNRLDTILNRIQSALLRRRFLRQWFVPALMICAAVLAIATAATTHLHSDAPSCDKSSRLILEQWNSTRRTRFAQAFESVGLSDATAIWEKTQASVDMWFVAHVETTHALCERAANLPRVSTEQASEDIATSYGCLGDEQAAVAALLTLWEHPTKQQVLDAPAAIAAMATPNRCLDAAAVRRRTPMPLDPQQRRHSEKLRQQLTAARIYGEQSQFAEADASLHQVASQVIASRDLALLAEYYEVMSRLSTWRVPPATTQRLLSKALTFARASGHWRVAGYVAAQLAVIRSYFQQDSEGREERLRTAQSVVTAGGSQLELLWQVTTQRAVDLCIAGDQVAGGNLFYESLLLAREAFGPDSHEYAQNLFVLGANASYRGDFVGALDYFEQAASNIASIVGPHHPDTLRDNEAVAQTLLRLHETPRAQQLAVAVLSNCLEAGYSEGQCARPTETAAETYASAGQLLQAADLYQRAIFAREQFGARSFPGDPWPATPAALVSALRGDHELAFTLAKTGIDQLEREGNFSSDALALARLRLGQIAVLANRPTVLAALLAQLDVQLAQPSELRNSLLGNYYALRGTWLASFDLNSAIEQLEASVAHDERMQSPLLEQLLHRTTFADLLLLSGNPQAAAWHATLALQLVAQAHGHATLHLPAAVALARAELELGEVENALMLLETAQQQFDSAQQLDTLLAPVHFLIAKALFARNDATRRDEAFYHLQTAKSLFLQSQHPVSTDVAQLNRMLAGQRVR